jgi:hypothetical protein
MKTFVKNSSVSVTGSFLQFGNTLSHFLLSFLSLFLSLFFPFVSFLDSTHMDSVNNLTWAHTRYDYTPNLLREFENEFGLNDCDQSDPKCQLQQTSMLEDVNGLGLETIYISYGRKLVHMYTHDQWFTAINNILLQDKQRYYPIVDCMTYYLKLYSQSYDEVYRGVRVDVKESEYILDRFTSFTTDIEVARRFGGTIITLKRPPIAAPIEDISYYETEKEVLLPPCTRLSREPDGTFVVQRRRAMKDRFPPEAKNLVCCCCYSCCICFPVCATTIGALLGLVYSLCGWCAMCGHACCYIPSQQSNMTINLCYYCEFMMDNAAGYIERAHSQQEAKRTCCLLCIPGYSLVVGMGLGFCFFCPGSSFYKEGADNPSAIQQNENESQPLQDAPAARLNLARRMEE